MSILVIGGTGTVGGRVTARLRKAGHDVRVASRHTEPRFDWTDPGTWSSVLHGVPTMFVLLPDQTEMPEAFLPEALRAGVRRVVLHSDRGLEVMGLGHLQKAEDQVRDSAPEWSIVRPDWFHQDFETFFRQPVIDGRLSVPVGDAAQGFIDADDIAAVEVAALTGDDLLGRLVEVTGPRALSFGAAAATIAAATGRPVEFDGSPDAFRAAMRSDGLPDEIVESLIEGYTRLRARGDTEPTGTVEAILGRPGRDFADYAAEATARGVWDPAG
ncbi:NAD(P)H-binding protein [Actinoplanes sichuanensis]|uniref:NAD-dependent epimerase/dehydratase family protein n=1 Tax=Actinoplanes sichuanensis TaxID=512349 RepID=A0ABW4AU50_9ACTN|nr:NAD-dependent epimerase/dehydratase family protein [Actinoplanes sichuanensis]BEL04715.1 NAD(P)H-binding protein [Actinoplanes sichuanensis]